MLPVFWSLKSWSQLGVDQLYEILRLRTEVFVVEQECPYQEVDGKDQESWHLMGFAQGKLIAYARLLPPGLHYEEASIGRVVTAPDQRGTGLGRLLMEEAIARIPELFNSRSIRIEAQSQLEQFYGSLGFIIQSEQYLLDGIMHTEMLFE
ncbi:MAG: GNAT family N-acetyltransferase [Bacteroidia bacterium]